MNVDQLLKFHLAFCYQAYRLMRAKNHDYAGADGKSPFRNFTSSEALGIATTEQGLLIRMTDKLNRLITFCRDGKLMVDNETATDALFDLINYSIILAAYVKDKYGTAGVCEEPSLDNESEDGAAPSEGEDDA